jgi:hypothetical protein
MFQSISSKTSIDQDYDKITQENITRIKVPYTKKES